MRITVVICTWNRAELLDQTLGAMHGLEVPAGVDWELLVVNNNCTDQTDAVIARHTDHLPLRRLFEPTPGKSHACNLAIAEATGELILWTDDDVLVDPSWLAAYAAAARRYPDAGFFGGKIAPWFEGSPPRWLREHWGMVANAFAVRDLGDEPFRFDARVVPYGANFSVRTAVQRAYPFDTDLGPRPGSALRMEEIVLIRQMIADGVVGWWVPAARVRHFIPTSRQSTRYLLDYGRGYGEYLTIATGPVEGVHWFGKPRWMWRQLVTTGARYHLRRLWASPRTWLRDLMIYAEQRGKLAAYDRAVRTP
jgi:glucosyl-dolichyl phosphate glucuronosyltransferase